VLRKIRRATFVLRETWNIGRAVPNDAVLSSIASTAASSTLSSPGRRVTDYLLREKPIAKISARGKWFESEGEQRLDYDNNIFGAGRLRVRGIDHGQDILVALPGLHTGAESILASENHPHYLADLADETGMAIAAWDWPLQAGRLDNSIYRGLGSVYSAEREYSRILPSAGTCLWREYVHELEFSLRALADKFPNSRFHVVGWSMGAAFAPLSAILARSVRSVISAGSCAAVADLIHGGHSRVHGYFFYPMRSLGQFDLEDVALEAASTGVQMLYIHGDRDPGCLAQSRRRLERLCETKPYLPISIDVLFNHGHVLSPTMKEKFREFTEGASAT
jgi:hypothetical protein